MGDFHVYCVKVHGHAETKALMEDAFKCLNDQQLSPVWFTEDECLTVQQKEKNVYIFDVFAGKAFQHIADLGCRIYGPLCIITSLACKKEIPRKQKPIYNLAMKDLIICCSNMDRVEREPVHQMVEWMSGDVSKDFTHEVTHLVAGLVGSKKYLVAGSFGCKIMLPKWVHEVWSKSQLEPVHGLDEQFQVLKCPIFLGCVITVSGLNPDNRSEAKRLIEKEGGIYSGEMKFKECTHLIINECKGQKYQFAKKWQIHIVRSDWLYESIEKGFCQDEKNYAVDHMMDKEGLMKTSTPEKERQCSSITSSLTDISNISMISTAFVNETGMSNVINVTHVDDEDPTDNLDVSKVPANMFLDGCKIFLSGFRGQALEKLRKIINIGGGTRFNQVSDNLSHIVKGERIPSDIEKLKALSNRPHVVTCHWLVDCYKQGRLVEESHYSCLELPPLQNETTPIACETNVVNVKKSQVSKLAEKTYTADQDSTINPDDMADIMSQYMANDDMHNSTTVASEPNPDMPVAPEVEDDNVTTTTDGGIFVGKSFVFYGFDEDSIPVLSLYVKENGGSVLKSNSCKIPDFAVVPIEGFPVDQTVKDIVTNAWLQMCIEQNELLDIYSNPLYSPIELNVDNHPLEGCVLSVSGYVGTERDCLVSIAEVLGAKVQDYFVRTTKNDLDPSTHLIVNAPEGSKYMAAKKWGIPALSKMWILTCANTGKREPEENYIIDQIPDNIKVARPILDTKSLTNCTNQSVEELDKKLHNSKEKQSVDLKVPQSKSVKVSTRSDNLVIQTKSIECDQHSRQIHTDIVLDSSKTMSNNGECKETKNAVVVDTEDAQSKSVTVIGAKAAGAEDQQLSGHMRPDFSQTGDTEAILLQMNSQGEQDSVFVIPKHCLDLNTGNNVSAPCGTILENQIANKIHLEADISSNNLASANNCVKDGSDKEIGTVYCAKVTHDVPVSVNNCVKDTSNGTDSCVNRDDNCSSRLDYPKQCNKDLDVRLAQSNSKSKEEVMSANPLDPPLVGSPALTTLSARDKLMAIRCVSRNDGITNSARKGKRNLKDVMNEDMMVETPPLTRFIKNLEKIPPKLGTPGLTKQSVRDKLMSTPYVMRNKYWDNTKKVDSEMAEGSLSQKENFIVVPAAAGRVKELQQADGKQVDIDTPSKFLNPLVRYYPKFDTEDLLKEFETPEDVRAARAKAKKKDSLSNEELFELKMKQAMNMLMEKKKLQEQEHEQRGSCRSQDEVDGDVREPLPVLQGVVITVAKKLAKDQSELNEIVVTLGGDYQWNYESSCTHFIFQGRLNDTAKDFKQAKSQGLKIVSPHWLYMCKEQNAKVDEALFPHTFNPNLALSVVCSRRTSLHTPRSARRPANCRTNTSSPYSVQPIVIPDDNDRKGETITSEGIDIDKQATYLDKYSADGNGLAPEIENTGSFEMREALTREIENFMAGGKGRKRKRSKKLNRSGTAESDLNGSDSTPSKRTQDNAHKSTSASSSSRSLTEDRIEEKLVDIAHSQSVPVVWDDPIRRMHQEKLAHQLQRAISPTQEVDSVFDIDLENAQCFESEGKTNDPLPPFGEQIQENKTPKDAQGPALKTRTPEGSSIAFPSASKGCKVTPSRAVVMDDAEHIEQKLPPFFLLSGMSSAERVDYGALVEQLGGQIIDSQQYDKSCTHLVINNISRNEKFLASIASGKWVLHKSYFEACRQEGKFVKEDFYEWGSEGTLSLVKNMESNVRLLAAAAHDWRIKIQEEQKQSPNHYGAFCSWNVILCCDKNKEGNYRRLLEAGGALVLNVKPPYNSTLAVSHALLELHKVCLKQSDLEILLASGCKCLKPEYISAFLSNPFVDLEEYIPAEISKLLAQKEKSSESLSSNRKRKAKESEVSLKKSKHT